MFPAEGQDKAFPILRMEGPAAAGFYRIDLATGAATMLADLGMGGFGPSLCVCSMGGAGPLRLTG